MSASSGRARRRLLLVHAHPDDETLATGGTIARYAVEPDTSVTLVTCTLGEQGEVMVPELAGLAADQADQLGGYRIAELESACAALGLTDRRFLGGAGRWRDSGMVTLAGVHAAAPPPDRLHPRAFCAEAARGEQVDTLAEILTEVEPQVVVCYDPSGGYGHPDHVRAHEINMVAAAGAPSVRKLYWTVPARSEVATGLAALADAPRRGLPWRLASPDELPSVPDDTVTTRLDVAGQLPAKVAALRAHATQLGVWEGPAGSELLAFALTNEIAQPVSRTESYTLVGAAGSVRPVHETGLFDGIEEW
jgi:N-acetyl-1-D-myo-inositol-2-amino-2-deoxy-alpha-D-glucopyranoside deacetylase